MIIKKFDPKVLQTSPSITFIVGKRSTGKTTLIKDLFHKNAPFIYDNYYEDIISRLLEEQKLYINNLKKQRIDPKTAPIVTIILEDCCLQQLKIYKDKVIREIFMNGRHLQISLVISVQYMITIPPDLRANIDYVFCLRENVQSNQKRLYDHCFFNIFKEFSHFQEVFKELTDKDNYNCLILKNTTTITEDCVFYYKAEL